MIYRVVLDDLYDLHTSDINCMLLNPSLELEMNSAGSFNFTLPPTHPYWDSIEILKSTIDVYEDDDLIFTGRVANIDKNWNNERVVECEGALAYFNDSIHRQMKWETPLPIASEDPTVHNFLKDILDNHNVFVGDAVNRQIHIGHIYVDPYMVTREVDYDTTLDILTRMCIDTNGGYFMIRKDPETHLLYLDWLKDFTEESGQPASFGVNLLDFNTGLHAADICTGVLARGATVNDQVVTLSNVELVDETTYPDMSVDHYTTHDQDILWHREGMAKFGRVVQVHEFPDAQTDWKNGGQVVANSLFEEARKWLEEKNTKVESIEVEVAELSWLQEGVPKYKLGQIVEILDDAHMAGEPYDVRRLPMYKLSCDLSSGSKKVTLGRPPKKELTQISASNSDSSTLSSGNSSGSSSGGGSGSGEECKVHDVRVDGTSVVSDKIANISLTGKADTNTVNALAATVATKADASTVTALANVVSGKQDQIEFNTLEAATETLTRLKADNVVYNIPSGGGGTDVEANPSGTATDDLNTVRIGSTIYDIPGGGGSSGGISQANIKTQYWTGTGSSTNVITFDEEPAYILDIGGQDGSSGTGKIQYLGFSIKDIQQNPLFIWYDPSTGIRTSTSISYNSSTKQLTFTGVDAGSAANYSGRSYYVHYICNESVKMIRTSDFHSEEETIIGRWIDGKPLYERTYVLRENGVNKYTIGGYQNREYQVELTGTERAIITKMFLRRSDGNWDDSRNLLNEVVVTFNRVDGSIYFNGTHNPTDIIVVIQYTKLADAPGTGPTPGNLIYLPALYSEDEREVGVWKDGKPLYQKTISNLNVSISPNDWRNVLKISDYFDDSLDYYDVVMMYANTDNSQRQAQYWSIANGYLRCYSYAVNTSVNLLTIRYTKTNDIPGSGTWTPEGQLAHHLSTTEQVVGTDVDGSTIYERTYILRENGVDNYQWEYGVHAKIGLTGVKKVWIHSFFSDRNDSSGYIDSVILSNEIVLSFYANDGSIYFQNSHNPLNIQVTLRYTKSS